MTSTEPSRGGDRASLEVALAEGLRPADLFGFADNLNLHLAAHEAGMEGI